MRALLAIAGGILLASTSFSQALECHYVKRPWLFGLGTYYQLVCNQHPPGVRISKGNGKRARQVATVQPECNRSTIFGTCVERSGEPAGGRNDSSRSRAGGGQPGGNASPNGNGQSAGVGSAPDAGHSVSSAAPGPGPSVAGPPGPKGDAGPPGPPGKDAETPTPEKPSYNKPDKEKQHGRKGRGGRSHGGHNRGHGRKH